ncbi:c-type cytochrome [Kaarinaea lacus]
MKQKLIMQGMVVTSAFLLIFSGAVMAGGDAAAGATKAAQCASCHGANGEGSGDNPKIAGMDPAAFVKAMNAYKTGAKKHMMMEMFAKKLSDQDNADLAAHYATK